MTVPLTNVPVHPQVSLPEDPLLGDLSKLFDGEWIWETFSEHFRDQEPRPQQIRVFQYNHVPGRQEFISYTLEWPADESLPSECFTVGIKRNEPIQSFRYPEDPNLPGLGQAAYPETATKLVNKYVLTVPVRRIQVGLVRYRPRTRAVLVHRIGKVMFFVRVVRPTDMTPILAGAELIGRSRFVVPRIAGHWPEGGTLWMSKIPGANMREYIRDGNGPDPALLFDRLESLWTLPSQNIDRRPFNLNGSYDRAKRIFNFASKGHGPIVQLLNDITKRLDQFVESWEPTHTAHNDFYDDQMLMLPDGNIALVDFEEAGPGDPMLDVGNFLAHLRWAASFGRKEKEAETCRAYHFSFRRAALERFSWTEQDLALREAICLFRTCTNTLRHVQSDWDRRLESGLALVDETLG